MSNTLLGEAHIDQNLKIVLFNDNMARFYNTSVVESIGRDLRQVATEAHWKRISSIYQSLINASIKSSILEFETEWRETQDRVLCEARYSIRQSVIREEILFTVQRREAARMESKGTMALTPTERSVLAVLARGLCTKEISQLLNQSCHTVATHRKNICRKLGAHSTAELVKAACEYSL